VHFLKNNRNDNLFLDLKQSALYRFDKKRSFEY
jgi:hypothetical protein